MSNFSDYTFNFIENSSYTLRSTERSENLSIEDNI